MPRSCLPLVSLLAFLTTASSLAQAAEDIRFEPLPSIDRSAQLPSAELSLQPPLFLVDQPSRLPSVEQSPPALPSQESNPAGKTPISGELSPTDKPINLDGSTDVKPAALLGDFMGYRYSTDALEWIPGGGDQFGIFSVLLGRYQQSGIQNGIMAGFGFQVFSGPVQSDMPPRAYDFSIGYQIRQRIGPLAFDLASAVQASSDFNGDARKGIQYPGHGVGFLTVSPEFDLVLGVDYLDRADIKLLPVAGLIWKPNPEMRFELVFPRPRAVFQLTGVYRLYFSGELGGGTWAIERVTLANDLATYRDLRACIGLESVEKDGRQSAIEIGYLFDRRLEYTSGIGNMQLDDAVMLRLVTMF
jgi:hypothetical protein